MGVKDPELDHPVHDLIERRWSPCVFSDKPVEPALVRSLFEAARWAPSRYNDQPWRWLINFRGSEGFDRIVSLLHPQNQEWATQVPLIGISIARLYFDQNGKPNRHAFHDVGCAMGFLAAQACAEGLSVRQMSGFDRPALQELLGLPEGHEIACAFAVGYVGDPTHAPDPLRVRDTTRRERKKIGELVYLENWGEQWNG